MSFEAPLPPYNANDPYATFLSASCMELLLVEMVPMAHRLADELGSQNADEEEHRDAAYLRLESLGYRVGQGLVERCVHHRRT